jgi:DNA-binding response OmpR family regulator
VLAAEERNSYMPTTFATSIRVLLVDDNEELLVSLCMALKYTKNLEVYTASDGIAGLEQAEALHPACIIIDVRMPGLDGLQLVRALRGDPQTQDIPLIILSAMVQERDQTVGYLSGADSYLTKPFELEDLLAAIQDAIQMSYAQRMERLRTLADAEPPLS